MTRIAKRESDVEPDALLAPHRGFIGLANACIMQCHSKMTMVTEWVALVGGLEPSLVLPSLSWMVGVRTRDGAEFGIGPHVTPAGKARAFEG